MTHLELIQAVGKLGKFLQIEIDLAEENLKLAKLPEEELQWASKLDSLTDVVDKCMELGFHEL